VNSPSARTDPAPAAFSLDRHQLAFVSPAAWRSALAGRPDFAAAPLVEAWARRGWPLISRRPLPGEGAGVPLGLPLPPFAGKRRLCFLMRPEDVLATSAPPALAEVLPDAPISWRATICELRALASKHAVTVQAFGSLAWRTLTGLDYVTASSDLDVLFRVHSRTDLRALAAGVAEIDAVAPMRVDGELVRSSGVAVNWRELLGEAREVLVKSTAGVELVDRDRFCDVGGWR